MARHADAIIVPSEYLKKIVAHWGVAEEKITVIYNAFALTELSESKEELKRSFGFSGNTIISAGRLVPWKGFALLIECMPDILKEISDVMLIIVGDGPQKNMLAEKIKSLGLEKNVVLKGKMEHSALLRFLKAADVFALNTAYEGFSHQILEVMALGTPVVTTRVGGNPELICPGENGILVSYDDAPAFVKSITAVLRDAKMAHALSEEARKTAASFSVRRMIQETNSLISNI